MATNPEELPDFGGRKVEPERLDFGGKPVKVTTQPDFGGIKTVTPEDVEKTVDDIFTDPVYTGTGRIIPGHKRPKQFYTATGRIVDVPTGDVTKPLKDALASGMKQFATVDTPSQIQTALMLQKKAIQTGALLQAMLHQPSKLEALPLEAQASLFTRWIDDLDSHITKAEKALAEDRAGFEDWQKGIASGTGSAPYTLAAWLITAMTKQPAIGSGLFGLNEWARSFSEDVRAGFPEGKAFVHSLVNGIIEGGGELIAGGRFVKLFDTISSPLVKRIVSWLGTELLTELGQESGQAISDVYFASRPQTGPWIPEWNKDEWMFDMAGMSAKEWKETWLLTSYATAFLGGAGALTFGTAAKAQEVIWTVHDEIQGNESIEKTLGEVAKFTEKMDEDLASGLITPMDYDKSIKAINKSLLVIKGFLEANPRLNKVFNVQSMQQSLDELEKKHPIGIEKQAEVIEGEFTEEQERADIEVAPEVEAYAERQQEALLQSRIKTLTDTDSMQETVKFIRKDELIEAAEYLGLSKSGNKRDIGLRIQQHQRAQEAPTTEKAPTPAKPVLAPIEEFSALGFSEEEIRDIEMSRKEALAAGLTEREIDRIESQVFQEEGGSVGNYVPAIETAIKAKQIADRLADKDEQLEQEAIAAAKEPKVKRSKNFETEGTYEVTMPDGTQTQIYRDTQQFGYGVWYEVTPEGQDRFVRTVNEHGLVDTVNRLREPVLAGDIITPLPGHKVKGGITAGIQVPSYLADVGGILVLLL